MAKPFLINDETLNRYGFRILTSGIQTDEFLQNPLMLKDHADDVDDVIGKWNNLRVNGAEMVADPEFDMEDPESAVIAGKVERGYVKCCSIGVIPLETSSDPADMLPGQTLPTVTKCILVEVSVVAKGANKNARVMLMDDNGKRIQLTGISELLKLKQGIVQPKLDNMSKINELLKLKADATPTEVELAVQQMISAKDKAEADLQVMKDKEGERIRKEGEAKKQEAITLTDTAIKDGRINASAKESYLKLFDGDFDSAKLALEAIPARQSLTDQLGGGDSKDEYQELMKMTWSEIDKENKLGVLKMKFPELYKVKFEEFKAQK